MGCGISAVPAQYEETSDRANEVDRQLLKQHMASLYEFKILLLGAGESGKSTVVKQLRTIHNKKLTPEELLTIGDSLHQNVMDCIKALLLACQKFGVELDDDIDRSTADRILNFNEPARIDPELGESIARLFHSHAIQTAYARRSEFWLLDGCNYYIKALDRITDPSFVPSEEDQVMARVRTTGIVVSELEQKLQDAIEGEPDVIKFQVVDVGGQRNERKKWLHCFDDVKCILFVVNLGGYNQVLFEDTSRNRMIEAVELFQEIATKPVFANTPIFLFLNKKDIFEQMVKETDLSVTFKDYTGGKNLDNALEYVKNKFRSVVPKGLPDKRIQIVTSVWKRDIKCAFEDVKMDLLSLNRAELEKQKNQLKKEHKKLVNAPSGKRRKESCVIS